MKRPYFYLGLFVTCAAVTTLQIVQTRILSVTSFYYLAFLAISMAMFGMTAGAVWVYEHRERFTRESLPHDLAAYAFRFAISVALCLLLQLSQPLVQVASAMMFVLWAELALVLAVPFFFAGVVVSLALTRSELPVGEVYAADLLGASLGCLGALALLNLLDGPSAIFAVAAMAAVGASLFACAASSRPRRLTVLSSGKPLIAACALIAVAVLNSHTYYGLQPLIVKDAVDHRDDIDYEKWNSYSRIHVGEAVEKAPKLWAASDRMPDGLRVWQRPLDIDGSAATNMFGFGQQTDAAAFLKYDVTNVAYSIRHAGRAAVIGVGGGRDVLSAWSFGFRDITGVELNPIFIDLLTHRQPFAEFAGLSKLPGIRFHADEARSWFARTKERFDLIQMSMIDTWAATGAGAFSLSENGLYTVEGWHRFIDALTPTGVFTVSRWYGADAINETGRLLSLASRVLMDFGVTDPESHLALVANHNLATLILSRQPLSAAELHELHHVADEMNFQVVLAPDTSPATPLLGRIAEAHDPVQLASALSGLSFDLTPPRDNRPFFFNQLPLTQILNPRLDLPAIRSGDGVVSGNLAASIALLVILFVATMLVVFVIVAPLRSAIRQTKPSLVVSGTVYFLFLGAGFMFVEMSLLQRFSLFLGHPVYSLSIGLFAMILSTGAGSLLSEQLKLDTKLSFTIWAALLTTYIACLPAWLPGVLEALESTGIATRGATAVGIIAPAGLLMGFGFPSGMRMVLRQDEKPAPWFWGINGAAGVLGSILAVAVGITFGIDDELYSAAVCYAELVPAAVVLWPRTRALPIRAVA